jgi:hypothetical protein
MSRVDPIPAFLVFGAERSGTTLLCFLLSGQPDTFVVNDSFVFDQLVEWDLLRHPRGTGSDLARAVRLGATLAPDLLREIAAGRGGPRARYHAARARRFARLPADHVLAPAEVEAWQGFLRRRYRHSLAFERASFLNDYAAALTPPIGPLRVDEMISATLAALARHYGTREGVAIGEKTPLHTLYADAILRLTPHARAILLVREPAANVGSMLRHYRDLPRAIAAYARYASAILTLKDDPRVLVLRHEDVATRTPEAIERALAFLDPRLRFDPACRVNAYTKEAYTGSAVDAARARAGDAVLTPADRDRIRRRFRKVYAAFYD